MENQRIQLSYLEADKKVTAPNLIYNTGDQTISGIKTFDSTPNVNGTPFSLSGSNVFVVRFDHNITNMNNNTYFFSNLSNLGASTTSAQRSMNFMQRGQARFASWNTYATGREQDSTNLFSSGYFVNNTTNISGLISDRIRHAANLSLYNFTGAIIPAVNVNFGDKVQIVFRVPNYTTGMSDTHNAVDVTFAY